LRFPPCSLILSVARLHHDNLQGLMTVYTAGQCCSSRHAECNLSLLQPSAIKRCRGLSRQASSVVTLYDCNSLVCAVGPWVQWRPSQRTHQLKFKTRGANAVEDTAILSRGVQCSLCLCQWSVMTNNCYRECLHCQLYHSTLCEEYQELTPFLGYSHVWLIQESHIFQWADQKKTGQQPSPNFHGL